MRIILEVTSGPLTGRRLPLQAGERARFGSSEVADVCFPDDEQMEAVHFELQAVSDGCLLRDLTGRESTAVNGQPVLECALQPGDTICAGRTELTAHIVLSSPPATDDASDESAAETAPIEPASVRLAGVKLSPAARALLTDEIPPAEFVEALVQKQLFADALRALAHLLSPHDVIAWMHGSTLALQGDQPFEDSIDQQAMKSVGRWLEDPSEEHRRRARDSVEGAALKTSARWTATAVAWSGGSLAPDDLPEVPPDPSLVGKAAAAGLLIAALGGDPRHADQRYQAIIELGRSKAGLVAASTPA